MNLNKAFILGRVCTEIADKEIPSTNTRVAEFSVATNSVYGKGDKKTENVQYHNITVFGKTAENCITYLTKGQLIFIEGRIQTRKWKNAANEVRVKTEIIAENIQFGPRAGSDSLKGTGAVREDDEDIPIIEDGEELPSSKASSRAPAKEIECDEIDVKDIPF